MNTKDGKVKMAFIFNIDKAPGFLASRFTDSLFQIILDSPSLNIKSCIRCGSFLSGILGRTGYNKIVMRMINTNNNNWNTVIKRGPDALFFNNLYIVSFESIMIKDVKHIDRILSDEEPTYVGSIQIPDDSMAHITVFYDSLIYKYRLCNRDIKLIWDGRCKDSIDTDDLERLNEHGFYNVELEEDFPEYFVDGVINMFFDKDNR